MADHVPTEKRSEIMRAVRGKDTRPERLVRSAAHRLGLRFRLHDPRLPGRPDMVLRRWKTVIFINGCYWHRHRGCRKATTPKSNVEFWEAKFAGNQKRDQRNYRQLAKLGWRVVVLWQCEVESIDKAMARLRALFALEK
ncbi:MAG: very short patch repair endonuclease [Dyella sp.]|uniref:very short patch repair endonuclease n=1 Tax=Dyella sp. TaxID=1869338 RepID=UPI003F7E71F0